MRRPRHDFIGEVHLKQVYEIAKIKQKDAHMSNIPLESICRLIVGSASSMGIKIVATEKTDTDYTAAKARQAELKRGKVGAKPTGKDAAKGAAAAAPAKKK